MQEPAHQSGLDRRVAVVRRWTRDVARAQRPAWPPDSRRSGPTRLCPAFAHDRTPLFPFAPSRPKVPGVGPSLRCGARRCICSNVSCGSRESNGLVVVPAPLGAIFCRQWCSRAVGDLRGGGGATWQERSRLPGRACQCQQGAAHGNVRAAATLSAAFARPRVAAFASPRPCAARRCQKTLIALVPAGRSSLRPRCVELARVRPGASMRACPGDIFGTFMARGACVPLFQRPSNASAERPGKCEFFVFNRTRGLAGMGGVV